VETPSRPRAAAFTSPEGAAWPSVNVSPLDGKIRVDLAPASEDDVHEVTCFPVDLAVDPLDGGVPPWRNVGGEVGSRVGLLVSALAGRGRRSR